MIDIDEKLPKKGEDIIGYSSNGDKHYCFRCDCHDPNCKSWRCSLTGFELLIDIVKWKYDDEN